MVVPIRGTGAGLDGLLESLAAQRLPEASLEVVLVCGDAPPAADAAALAQAHPGLRLRLVTMYAGSSAAACTVGLRAARGEYCLLARTGDRFPPDLLEALLDRLAQGASATEVALPQASELWQALLAGVGLLVRTEVARRGSFKELGEGAWLVHWLRLWQEQDLHFSMVPVGFDPAPPSGTGTLPPGEPDSYETEVLAPLTLIGHLRGCPLTAAEPRACAEQIVTEQARTIRGFLLRHPDRHRDVVEEVRHRRIPRMPWSVLNQGQARHLALLYLSTPFLDTSALVAARRLRERGLITDVISQDVGNLRRSDPLSDLVAAEVVDEARMLPGHLPVAEWRSVVTFTETALAQVAELEEAKGPYESVYSRAMAIQSHFAAALLKLRSPQIHWVAEFSDPMLFNARAERRVGDVEEDWLVAELAEGLRRAGHAVPTSARIYEWGELLCYALADEIVFTNQHQLDLMLGYCADRSVAARAARIARVEHHPVPTPDLYEMAESRYPLSPGRLHIGYFGNFYANRGLTEITSALARLTLAERDRIQLHVFTSNPEPLVLQLLADGLSDVVTVNPMLGFLAYLNLTTRFDVLLITDFETRPHYDPNPFLPAKLADYLGSGSAIWAAREPGSVLGTFEVAYSSELGDTDSATATLRELAALAASRSLA